MSHDENVVDVKTPTHFLQGHEGEVVPAMEEIDGEDFTLPEGVEMPQEFIDMQANMQAGMNDLMDPEVRNPNSEKYNPYMGKSVGSILKSLLSLMPGKGIRSIVSLTAYTTYEEDANGVMQEVQKTISRKRLQDILDDKVTTTPDEDNRLYEIASMLIEQNNAEEVRKRARREQLKKDGHTPVKRPKGITRAQWRAMTSKKKK